VLVHHTSPFINWICTPCRPFRQPSAAVPLLQIPEAGYTGRMAALAVSKAFQPQVNLIRAVVITVCIGLVLWLISRYDYLLFHSISRIFSIAWHARVHVFVELPHVPKHGRSCSWASATLVAVLDMFHTFSYQGMNVLPAAVIK